MSRFLNKDYSSLVSYTPGEQPKDKKYIKLNTNESPYPPSDGVLSAVSGGAASELCLYPDPCCTELKEAIAAEFSVCPENVFVSNGSDDILNFAFMAFAGRGGHAFFPDITYGFYEVFCDLHGISYTKLPLMADFSVNPADYYGKNSLIAIANPNAPTGMALTPCQIEEIIKANPDSVVMVDEAYVDFGAQSCAPLINRYDNLLVVQTFSKSRSLAGARLGFALSQSGIIADLEKIKYSTNPYSINRLSLLAGCAALSDSEYYTQNCKEIIKTREWVRGELLSMGFNVLPSCANFLFAEREGLCGKKFYEKLREGGVLVRHFDKDRISSFNRITIGTREQMEEFIRITKTILEKEM